MINQITVDVVLEDGKVDELASTQAFQAALSEHIAQYEVESSAISDAVNAVFDQYPGKAIASPTLASLAAMKLNATPANHGSLCERVLDFVRANQGEGGTLQMRKGKGGGISRVADLPAAK